MVENRGLVAGKVAFITGAASGLGAAMAQRFAGEGARVVVADIQREAGQALCDSLVEAGGEAFFVFCDVSDADSVHLAIEAAVARFGTLNIVCANAGINGVFAPIEELQPDEWDNTMAVNLKSSYLTVHFAVPHLKRAGGGAILITSSVNGNRVFAYPGATAYCVSKAGQVVLAKMMALELGRHNIRCNAICPGAFPTNIGESTVERNTRSLKMGRRFTDGNPALNQGWGQPVDVANAALFLASDMGLHISGEAIYIDGGASLF